MTVGELIDMLESMDNRDAEVRLATQPAWPLAYNVAGVIADPDIADDDEALEIVWIVEGDHPDGTPYAPAAAFEAARNW